MKCPNCGVDRLSDDAKGTLHEGRIGFVKGRVNAVIHPDQAHYPPFSQMMTVSLYRESNEPVVYLKFATEEELEVPTTEA